MSDDDLAERFQRLWHNVPDEVWARVAESLPVRSAASLTRLQPSLRERGALLELEWAKDVTPRVLWANSGTRHVRATGGGVTALLIDHITQGGFPELESLELRTYGDERNAQLIRGLRQSGVPPRLRHLSVDGMPNNLLPQLLELLPHSLREQLELKYAMVRTGDESSPLKRAARIVGERMYRDDFVDVNETLLEALRAAHDGETDWSYVDYLLALEGVAQQASRILEHVVELGIDTVRRLLDAGVPVHESDGYVALFRAVEQEREDIALLLLRRGVKLSYVTWYDDMPPLHRSLDKPNLLEALIAAGDDIDLYYEDEIDQTGTPLMLAARNGEEMAVDRLIRAGAKLESSNYEGETALCLAVLNNHLGCARRLIRAGASIHAVTDDCIDAACDPEMVRLLLEEGTAEVNEVGRTTYASSSRAHSVDPFALLDDT